jgi:tetratricopeptide (TPR) repeat protein
MSRSKWLKIFTAILALGFLGILVYQIPWVEQRLSWRIDIAQTYVRGVLNPAGAVPTPISAAIIPTKGTTPSSTPSPTAFRSTPINVDNNQNDADDADDVGDTDDAGDTDNVGGVTLVPKTATPTQTPEPTQTPTSIPGEVELPAPEWEKQDWNNCGPAALSMYLNYYGWEGDQFSVSGVLKPQREDRNVNVEELVHYARNYAGWLNTQYRVGGDIDLLKKFVAAGIPVMVESSFYFEGPYWPNDDLWAAHYLLVDGYDEARGTFNVQDTFYGPNQTISYGTLDAYWKPFNRVYILIYPPDQEDTVRSILGAAWDEVTNRQLGLDAAQAEVDADPKDAYAWFNLGTNLLYFERYEEAAAAYDQARTIGWPQRMLRYQFGPFFAYFHTNRTEDLLVIADYALERTYNSEEAFLWRGWARYRDGDYNGAVADFQAALEANYLYQDARYALDFVTGQ